MVACTEGLLRLKSLCNIGTSRIKHTKSCYCVHSLLTQPPDNNSMGFMLHTCVPSTILQLCMLKGHASQAPRCIAMSVYRHANARDP